MQQGTFNKLVVDEKIDKGYMLKGTQSDERAYMPFSYALGELEEGDEIEAFIFRDNSGLVATQERPLALLGEFAVMQVAEVSDMGAFVDWGIGKQLLVPYRAQGRKLRVGEQAVIHVVLDPVSDRLMGSTKVSGFLSLETEGLKDGQEVDLLVYSRTDLGYGCIVNQKWKGLLYESEVFDRLHMGSRLRGFIRQVRPDGQLDLCLRRPGYRTDEVEQEATALYGRLTLEGGTLPIGDKSDPEQVYQYVRMSKKHFKKVIGYLYKQGKLEIEDYRIRLKK